MPTAPFVKPMLRASILLLERPTLSAYGHLTGFGGT